MTGKIFVPGIHLKFFEIDMAQGQDMPKGPGTEENMFLSAFVPEI